MATLLLPLLGLLLLLRLLLVVVVAGVVVVLVLVLVLVVLLVVLLLRLLLAKRACICWPAGAPAGSCGSWCWIPCACCCARTPTRCLDELGCAELTALGWAGLGWAGLGWAGHLPERWEERRERARRGETGRDSESESGFCVA